MTRHHVARSLSWAAGLVIAALLAFGSREAWAQDKGGAMETPPPPADQPQGPSPITHPDLWVDIMMRRSWKDAPARLFVAATFDLGWVYVRPRLSAGYGKPFTSWFGVDVNPIVSASALGVYGGLRLNLPRLSWRGGGRYSAALYRTYLDAQDNIDRIAFDARENGRAGIATFETELEGSLPVGPGDILALASVSYVTNVPDGKFAFEETLRVIVDPPWVYRARVGYSLRFGTFNQHSVGWVVDVLDVPDRSSGLTIRSGPVVRIVLSRRVEVRASFVATVVSPDNIGLAGSDFTELGLRYRWATE